MPDLVIRPGHPDFLDLPWDTPLADWDHDRIVELPKGISRHVVRFVCYPQGIYAIKELAERPAHRDYEVLRQLEPTAVPVVEAVGLVGDRSPDRHSQDSAALITAYEDHSFSYRELLEGPDFGRRRDKMMDALAGLLVDLHLAGCFWGDCSLSNVLYRWDAEGLDAVMVDAETAEIHENLTDGQREEDLQIMAVNVAGGMADIAAAAGRSIDEADLFLGEEIMGRYSALWDELVAEEVIPHEEGYRITERVARLNELGFDVDEIDLVSGEEGNTLRIRVKVGGRSFHTERLRSLTGVEALDRQARQILSDLYYFQAKRAPESPTNKSVAAVQWRVGVFEPMLERLTALDPDGNPVQLYCDLLHHRYLRSADLGQDVGTEAAYESWIEAGRPGFLPSEDGPPAP